MNTSKPESRPQRLLGSYLFGLCLYQIAIYNWPGGPPFVLDPRAGIAILLINHFSFDNKVVYPVEWITATWLIVMAAALFFRGKLRKIYIVSELLMAAPTAYYIAMLARRHGRDFAPGFKDLIVIAALFTIFSLFPVGWAIRTMIGLKSRRAA